MLRTVALVALLSISVSACGRQPAPSAAPTASSTPSATAPSPAPGAAVAAPDSRGAAQVAQAENAQEATATEAQDEPGTASLEHLAQLSAQQQLPDGRWQPGVSYDPVVPAQPTSVPAGKVEVMEVFWYACPHCFALESHLTSWRKTKPEYVQFVRVPVMWGPVHRAHARLYYTLQALGRGDLDAKVFDTIHNGHNLLVGNSDAETLALQTEFAKAQGLDPEAFRKAYDSFGVNTNLQRAEQVTLRYHVEGVPLIIINGKYSTDMGKAGTEDKLFAIVDDLAASEHRH
jgi:thiol:disulfide interchange protein DsbA